MLFIYEPIVVFKASNDSFWFGFDQLINSNSLYFFYGLIISAVISIIVILLNLLTKDDFIHNLFLTITSCIFIILYIHGNYLAKKLPVLDGSTVNWSSYKTITIISLIICLIVITAHTFMFIKYRDKVKTITVFLALSIFVMLSTSLVPILVNLDNFKNVNTKYVSTTKNINNLSTNKNFLILLADMVDSKTFDNVLKKYKKYDTFKDFTYFPDTLSMYPFTRESIPYLFGGEAIKDDISFRDWYDKSFTESKLLDSLKENAYEINIYEEDILWRDQESLEVSNIVDGRSKMDNFRMLKQEMKYLLFKYLPYSLKKYSRYDTIDYEYAKKKEGNEKEEFSGDSVTVYNQLDEVNLQNDNYFQFLHFDGGHYPWDLNMQLEHVERTTYQVRVESAYTVIEKYIDRIKESGQYDNTVIILISDHGHNVNDDESNIGRQNPILFIKGFNETHDQMQISDKKVSFEDLNESIYLDLMNGKESTELLQDIDDNRLRHFMWSPKKDPIHEQVLDGHAWETDKLKDTGTIYERLW